MKHRWSSYCLQGKLLRLGQSHVIQRCDGKGPVATGPGFKNDWPQDMAWQNMIHFPRWRAQKRHWHQRFDMSVYMPCLFLWSRFPRVQPSTSKLSNGLGEKNKQIIHPRSIYKEHVSLHFALVIWIISKSHEGNVHPTWQSMCMIFVQNEYIDLRVRVLHTFIVCVNSQKSGRK